MNAIGRMLRLGTRAGLCINGGSGENMGGAGGSEGGTGLAGTAGGFAGEGSAGVAGTICPRAG